MAAKQLYLSRRVVTESGIFDGGVLVRDGVIESILTSSEAEKYIEECGKNINVIDGGRLALLAGVVDSHVHVNEPGRTAWEGFRTATEAAAVGGITTIVDMPLNSIPPTTTVANLETKASSAKGNVYVDVGFWGGVIPGNQDSLRALVKCGVVGFKCFLCPSGVEEFPNVQAHDLEKAFAALEGTGTVLAFHAEVEEKENTSKDVGKKDPEEYSTYLESRPELMELDAISLITSFLPSTDVRVHIVHVSSSAVVPLLEGARAGRRAAGHQAWQAGVSAETCHHYLNFSAEQIPKGKSEYKCAPPIRHQENKEYLWKYLLEDKINLVVSDHSPCTPDLKCSNNLEAWGGISSVQFGLSLFWTNASARGLDLRDVSRYLSAAPARLCGLQRRKGALRPGCDADLVYFDPDDTFTVTSDIIRHKNKLTPYIGKELKGVVHKTYLRGKLIYSAGEVVGEPIGQLLLNQSSTALGSCREIGHLSKSSAQKRLFLSKRVVTDYGEIDGGVLVSQEGIIEGVLNREAADTILAKDFQFLEVIDGGELALMPGMIDSHVHVNEPGRTSWEGYVTATQAAAWGGITTIIDMPLNSIPPTTTLENLKIKASIAKEEVFVDVGFWGGVIPGNADGLLEMVNAGVVGFKCFLIDSGVDEFPMVSTSDLETAFQVLNGSGTVLAFHAEQALSNTTTCDYNDTSIELDPTVCPDPDLYSTYLASRPPEMEINAVSLVASFVPNYDVHVHVVHVSAEAVVPILEQAREERVAAGHRGWRGGVTAETCNHYLTIAAEEIPPGHTEYKCSPPLRDNANKQKLWEYIRDERLDLITSDHSPSTANLKGPSFMEAWGGISSVQFDLFLFWTQASARGLGLSNVVHYLANGPALLTGLHERKGAIRVGLDADLIFFDPNASFVVTPEVIRYKNKISPYMNKVLRGKVVQTYLRGQLIYSDGELLGGPQGKLLLKELEVGSPNSSEMQPRHERVLVSGSSIPLFIPIAIFLVLRCDQDSYGLGMK